MTYYNTSQNYAKGKEKKKRNLLLNIYCGRKVEISTINIVNIACEQKNILSMQFTNEEELSVIHPTNKFTLQHIPDEEERDRKGPH